MKLLNKNKLKVIEQLVKRLKKLNFIFTSSVMIFEGYINKFIVNISEKCNNCIYFKNLGVQKYLSAIRYSCFMLKFL